MIRAGDPRWRCLGSPASKPASRPSGAQSRLAGLRAAGGPRTTSRARGGFGVIATGLEDVLRVGRDQGIGPERVQIHEIIVDLEPPILRGPTELPPRRIGMTLLLSQKAHGRDHASSKLLSVRFGESSATTPDMVAGSRRTVSRQGASGVAAEDAQRSVLQGRAVDAGGKKKDGNRLPLQGRHSRSSTRRFFFAHAVSLVHDIDDVENNEYGEYYSQRNPLTLAALERRSPGI